MTDQTHTIRPPAIGVPDRQAEIDAAVAMAQAALDGAAAAIVRCARGDQQAIRLGLRQLRGMTERTTEELSARICRTSVPVRYPTSEE